MAGGWEPSGSIKEARSGGFELLHDGSVSLPSGVRSFDPGRSRASGGGWCCGLFSNPASSTSATIIPCEDTVGAVRTGAELSVWHMPLNRKGRRTLRATTPIPFDSPSAAAEAREALIKASCHDGSSSSSSSSSPDGGRLEVMLNPASGPGKARAIWGALHPLFRDAAGIECTVTESAAPGHLTRVSRELPITGVRAVVVVGGDGTLHEVLQGLLGRPDWQEAARLPLLQVPAGSGNALSTSLRILDPFHAAYVAIKGSRRPLDAATVLHPLIPRTYSFLSVTTGLLANVDHGTEDLRWMGGSRFTAGALREILAKRTTRVRLRYLPPPNAADVRFAADNNNEGIKATSLHGPPCPLLSSLGIPLSDGASPASDTLEQLGKELLQGSRGWEELPDPLVELLVACNLPWLSETHHVAPPALLDDGAMTLVWTSKCTRAQGLQVLVKTETEAGDHMALEVVHHAKAAAMLLEPLQEDSLLVVDGELLPRGPVYVEVHPGLLTVLSDRPR